MRFVLVGVVLALSATTALAQTATVHIEVRSETGPVSGAEVVVNGTTHQIDARES
jgi:hypothetical protein